MQLSLPSVWAKLISLLKSQKLVILNVLYCQLMIRELESKRKIRVKFLNFLGPLKIRRKK